ncbi:hypothetical protein [Paraburkholderia sp. BL6669N2]|uniref:hypothetical protein n=1 Tax=Paraburkholderia sp. BL6669N2 TaxID=1938807 RepID=UPI0021633D34|nr:hypothetical protein [Paraburkholderia sp. BL6669N2]
MLGARIGRNCVIGANAVVTSDIPDFCVAVGAPARVVRHWHPDHREWLKGGPSARNACPASVTTEINHA